MSLLCYAASWYAFLNRSYSSFKTLRRGDGAGGGGGDTDLVRAARVKEAVQFWVVFALMTLFDVYVEFLVSWLPLYWYVKLAVLLWIANPHANGAVVTFEKVVQPRMARYVEWVETHAGPVVSRVAGLTGYVSAQLLLQHDPAATMVNLSQEELLALSRSASSELAKRTQGKQQRALPPPPPPLSSSKAPLRARRTSTSEEDEEEDEFVHVGRVGSVASLESSSTATASSSQRVASSTSPRLVPAVSPPAAANTSFSHPMYYPTRLAGSEQQQQQQQQQQQHRAVIIDVSDEEGAENDLSRNVTRRGSARKAAAGTTAEEQYAAFNEDFVPPPPHSTSYNQRVDSSADEVLELFDSPVKAAGGVIAAAPPPSGTVPSREREPLVSPVFSSSASTTTRRLSWLSPRWPYLQSLATATFSAAQPAEEEEEEGEEDLDATIVTGTQAPRTSPSRPPPPRPLPGVGERVTVDVSEDNPGALGGKRQGPTTRSMARRTTNGSTESGSTTATWRRKR